MVKIKEEYKKKVEKVLKELNNSRGSHDAVMLVASEDKKLGLFAAEELIKNKWYNKVENGSWGTPYEEVAMFILKRFIELKEWDHVAGVISLTKFYRVAEYGIIVLIKNKRNKELIDAGVLTELPEAEQKKLFKIIKKNIA